jgi:hypothetical protein
MRNQIAKHQLKLIASFVVLYGLAFLPTSAVAQGTLDQQANCQDDAMRRAASSFLTSTASRAA